MNFEDWRTKMIGFAVKFFPDNSYLCIASSVSLEASICQDKKLVWQVKFNIVRTLCQDT